jgi:phosphoenolpyruvate mutase
MPNAYVAMSADFIHSAHLGVIQRASELGDVTVGVLSERAIVTYKRLPLLSVEQRSEIVSSLKNVHRVVIQEEVDPTELLRELKPDFVVHGDDWVHGMQSHIRETVIKVLEEWGGRLIEVPYTRELSGINEQNVARHTGSTPEWRLSSLRRLIKAKDIVRIIEVHNGLCGLIAENVSVNVNGARREFDGMWESSLTDSTSKGKPDTSAVDVTSRTSTIDQILEVTHKPMIVDGDNGGLTEHFCFNVRTLERLGVSAVIIEDKVGPKRNSLFGQDAGQQQDTIEEFCHKIASGKRAQVTPHFMIFARIESLILGQGQADAMERAQAYVKAGADGIMIHSKEKTPHEVLEFCKRFREFSPNIPIAVVPSTYSSVYEKELVHAGVNVVIYANQLLRAAFPAMKSVAESILQNERCLEASENCMGIKEIITLIPDSI